MEPWLIAVIVITCVIVFLVLVWMIGWHFYEADFATSVIFLLWDTFQFVGLIATACFH